KSVLSVELRVCVEVLHTGPVFERCERGLVRRADVPLRQREIREARRHIWLPRCNQLLDADCFLAAIGATAIARAQNNPAKNEIADGENAGHQDPTEVLVWSW